MIFTVYESYFGEYRHILQESRHAFRLQKYVYLRIRLADDVIAQPVERAVQA